MDRPGDDGQAADMGQGKARQPVVANGHAQSSTGGLRRRGNRVVGENDALRRAGRTAGRHHQGVTGLDRLADADGGAQFVLGAVGKSLIDGKGSVTGGPDALQLLDERRPAGQVDGDEVEGIDPISP